MALDTHHITALRLYGHRDIRVDRVLQQTCGDDDVRVDVAYCGICGSDLHEFHGPVLCPQPGKQEPLTGCSLPVTLGHEISGTISEIGRNVSNVQVGDRVAVNPAIVESTVGLAPCADCDQGFPNSCARATCYGLGGPSGGFADEVVVKSNNVYKLPESVSFLEGALTEPLAVAWHSVRTAQFQPGQDALVLGAGPIGLAILQVLRVRGARNIIVTDIIHRRQEAARSFGASTVIDPLHDQVGVLEVIQEICGQDGVDIAFDTSGLQSTLDTAITCTKSRGTIFNVAIHEKPLLVNPTQLSLREKTFRGGNGYTEEDFRSVLGAMATGDLRVRSMVTAVVPLQQVKEKGFEPLLSKGGQHIKVLVQPGSKPHTRTLLPVL
ncbi:chaperonin 10-like protein [Aspergillus pseudocaelatus]|uniref:Chaperonin 10-like protein n=1 Tax=Aspergillus pseudocaelatus TaxID=1825620 RepID=A0ABQ6X2N8_9EURO|nr:chaperonin 10-like protein [Aspergillus pseudocaelatus]